MGFGWERGGVGETWEPPRARVSRAGNWPEWREEVREPGTGCVSERLDGVRRWGGLKDGCYMRTRDEKRAGAGSQEEDVCPLL